MTELAPAPPLFDAIRPILHARCAGQLAEDIALMQILLATADDAEMESVLVDIASPSADWAPRDAERLGALAAAAQRSRSSWSKVRAIARAAPHAPGGQSFAVGDIAARFDAAVALSPEASVALYCLGDPDRLAAATDEVVAWLDAGGLLGPDRDLLDLGCGVGRFAVALAPRVRSIVGIDVSAGMVAAGRQRTAGLRNVELRVGTGIDLAGIADASIDCVLAVDVFPYLALGTGDLVAKHFAEAARALRPGGHLVILNYSYCGDAEQDRRELRRHAEANGLWVITEGARPFRLWDGTVYHLVKADEPIHQTAPERRTE